MKEKLREYALIAEIIGGLAIVASLLFVGLQVRLTAQETALNTRQMQAMVYQELQRQIIERNVLNATDPESIRLLRKRVSGEPLDEVDRLQLLELNRARFRAGNSAYLQFENGIITKEQLESVLSPMIANINYDETIRQSWENEVTVTESFRNYIDSVIER